MIQFPKGKVSRCRRVSTGCAYIKIPAFRWDLYCCFVNNPWLSASKIQLSWMLALLSWAHLLTASELEMQTWIHKVKGLVCSHWVSQAAIKSCVRCLAFIPPLAPRVDSEFIPSPAAEWTVWGPTGLWITDIRQAAVFQIYTSGGLSLCTMYPSFPGHYRKGCFCCCHGRSMFLNITFSFFLCQKHSRRDSAPDSHPGFSSVLADVS